MAIAVLLPRLHGERRGEALKPFGFDRDLIGAGHQAGEGRDTALVDEHLLLARRWRRSA